MTIQNITFDKPSLSDKTEAQQMAVIDKWISDTVDKLNFFLNEISADDIQTEMSDEDKQSIADLHSDAVTSVNGETGDVEITVDSIGAATAEQGAKADSALQEIPDTYRTASDQDEIDNDKQDKEDDSLDTIEKSIIGAINEINSSMIYSTEPTACGTWTDGKTIYRKCFHADALPDSDTLDIEHGLSIGTLVNLYGTWYSNYEEDDPGELGPIPYSSPVRRTLDLELWVDATNVSVRSGEDWSSFPADIVIEYTIADAEETEDTEETTDT